jgi:hypothetical protein
LVGAAGFRRSQYQRPRQFACQPLALFVFLNERYAALFRLFAGLGLALRINNGLDRIGGQHEGQALPGSR